MSIKTENVNISELENLRAVLKSLQGLADMFSSHRSENSTSGLILKNVDMILDTYKKALRVCGVKSEEPETDTAASESADPVSSKTSNDRTSRSQENPVKRPVSRMTSGRGNNIGSDIKKARLGSGHSSCNSSSKVAVEVVDISDDEDEGSLKTSKIREVNQVVKPEVGEIGLGLGSDVAPSSADGMLRNVKSEPELLLNLIPEHHPSTSDTSVSNIGNLTETEGHEVSNSSNDTDNSDFEVNACYDEISTKESETLGGGFNGDKRGCYAAGMENANVEGISGAKENATESDRMNSGDKNSCVTSTTTCEQENVQSAASGNTGTDNQVFKENKVLQNIFKYLSFEDLKTCREVSSLCNFEAVKAIRKTWFTTSLQVTESWVTLYESSYSKIIKRSSVQEFSEFVKKSVLFPCNYFGLAASLLKNPDVQRFFSDHREIVEAVLLWEDNLANDECGRSTQILLEKFLGEQLPNLKFLSVFKSQKGKLFSEASKVQLKTLKILNLWGSGKIDSNFLLQILKAAPGLESLCHENDWFSNSDFRVLLKLKVMNLVNLTEFRFDFSDSNIELHEEILKQKLSFEKFDNVFVSKKVSQELWPRIGDVLSQFFKLNSQTLDCIDRWHPLGHITSLQLPVLPNVDYLRLFYKNEFLNLKLCDGAPVPMLPIGSNLADIFPILHNVKISFDSDIFEALKPEQVFPGDKIPLLSVQELSIWYTCDDDEDEDEGAASGIPTIWIKHFCEMFPNLSVAYFEFMQDFASSGKYVWKLHNLKELTLEIELNDKFNSNPFPSLDSTFTGFSRMKVKELHEQVPTDIQLSENDVKALRGLNPSIVDLHRKSDSASLVNMLFV